MATIGNNNLTLADWAKRQDPNSKVAKIVEMLGQTNEILDDQVFVEGNLPTGHRSVIRTGLPEIYWRILNKGVPSSKSTTAQVDEMCGIMEAWSEVDKELAMLNGDVSAFRLSEAQAFIEAMNQKAASTIFYGNSSLNPEEFTGLAPRYSSLSAANAQNILSAGGSGSDNTSVWLVCWGDQTCHGIFPKASQAGIAHFNHGEVTVQEATGLGTTRLRAFQDQWQWKQGLVVKDWRYVVRIANIDVSNLVANSGSQADLINFMIKAMHRLPTLSMGRCAFYMNRTVKQMLDIQRRDDVAAAGMTYVEVDGKLVPNFRGIPIKTVDAILENESVVA